MKAHDPSEARAQPEASRRRPGVPSAAARRATGRAEPGASLVTARPYPGYDASVIVASALRRSGLLILLVASGCLLPATASARILHRTYRLGPVALSPYQSKIRYGRVEAPGVNGFVTRMHARVVD